MRIVFNNEREIEITQEVADILRDNILKGAKQWQTFSDKDGKVVLFINLSEVSFIGNSNA
jgi:hypothetical protein